MGLDIVEFVISIEEALQVPIPDKDAELIETPGNLIDYLMARLPKSTLPACCLSQRAFNRLRQILSRRLHISRKNLRLDTDLLAFLPETNRKKIWRSIGDEIGVAKYWPNIATWLDWFGLSRRPIISNLTSILVARIPRSLMLKEEYWSRPQVAEVVHALMWENFGVRREDYTDNSRFVDDLGIS